MTTLPRTPVLLLALSLPMLAACKPAPAPSVPASAAPPTATTAAPQTMLGKTVDAALRKAREEIATQNIDISKGPRIEIGNGHQIGGSSGLVRAEITPKGDLLVDGKVIAVSPDQRAMLLDYRAHLIAIAEAGMAVGTKGADLAGKAVSEALSHVFGGSSQQARSSIEAEGEQLKAEAKKICNQLPDLLASQQKLAESLPEFRPYARMTQRNIDDCMKGDGAAVTSN